MKVLILIGAIRNGRQSHKIGYYLQQQLQARSVQVNLVDLQQTPLPLFQARSAYGEPFDRNIAAMGAALSAADAIILVSPEYHGSFAGSLKNALDFYWAEFQRKPVGVATGSAGRMGGINASSLLQNVILSMGAYPLPVKFLVPEVQDAFDDTGRPLRASLDGAASRFLDELLWFAAALSRSKNADTGQGQAA